MKFLYPYLLALITILHIEKYSAQTYTLTNSAIPTTVANCKGYLIPPRDVFGYASNLDIAQAFTNGGVGPIRINFMSVDLDMGDQIRIYEGAGTGGTLLAGYTGLIATTFGSAVTSTTGIITVRFTTTNTFFKNGDGFDAILGCPPVGCNGNSPAGDDCGSATRICAIDPYCGNTGGWYTADRENIGTEGSNIFCGSIENNSWLVFTANAANPSFKVDVSNCADPTSGIQMQIYATNCTTFTAVSPCINQNTAPTSFTLTANTPLTLGNDYYLMVDGFAGNYCSYSVTPLTGVAIPTISSITSNTICSGTTNTLTLNGTSAGATYTWTASSPGAIIGSVNNVFVITTPTITTTYSVTVNQLNGCASKTYTRSIVVNPTPTISIASVSNPTICSGNTTTITPNGANTYTLNPGGITGTSFTVSPTTTTTYSIVGTNTLGCKSANTATISITVNTTPTVAISNVSSPSICRGISTIITPTASPIGASTYTLLNTGTTGTSFTVSPTTTTTYSIVGSSSAGCKSTNTITTTITVYPIPTSTASSTGSITCINNTIILNSTLSGPGITYTWTAPSGSSITGSTNTQSTTVQGLGTYTLNLMGPGGCTYSTTVAAIQNTITPTSVNAGATQTLICGVPTVTLIGTATPSTSTANWLGGVINPTSFTTTTGSAGIYTLQAINPITGCFITSTVSVIQSVGSPSVNSNPVTFSITCTNTVVPIGVVVTSTNPVTYQWNTTGISGPTTNSTATATLAGVYSVTITNSPGNNCTTIKSITVPTNISPVIASITPAATITCNTPSLVLNANPGGANYTYTWTGTSPIVSGGSTKNPTINSGGTYSVAITNKVNGCVGYATITVKSNTVIPTTTLSTNSLSITCSNPTPSVSITTTASPVSYSWTPSNGIVGGTGTTSSPSFSLPGTYSAVVTNTVNGCSSATSGNVVTVGLNTTVPTLTLSNLAANNGTLTCTTLSVVVTPTVIPSSANYTWTSTTGTISSQSTVTLTSAGVYTLTVVDPINGCVTSATNTANMFTVYQNITVPTVTLIPISSNTIIGCGVNSTVTYSGSVTANNPVTYLWNPGGITTPTFVASTAGNYSVTVINAVNGCSTTAQFTVVGNPNIPNLTTNAIVTTACGSTITPLSASSTNTNVSYTWTGPINSIITGSATSNPTVNLAGNYVVTVTDLLTGCTNSAAVNVIQTVVNAGFTADPKTGIAPLTVNFTNTSTGASTYYWTFGNTLNSTNTNPNTIYNTGGTYTVMLIAISGSCSDTASAIIIVEDDLSIIIPNVFTPNGDGINDVFSITTKGLKEISLNIFNRWGLKLYDYTGTKAAWDGIISGSGDEAVDGTYLYIIKATGYDGKEINKSGSLSLFR